MTLSLIYLLIALPSFAQSPWQVSSSSVAVAAAESVVVYGGAPAMSKPDTVGSNTSDIVVVNAVEKDGLWSWTLLPLSTGTLSFVARFQTSDGKLTSAPPVTFSVTGTGVANEEDIADIKGPFKARPAVWPWLFAALLAGAAYYAWHRYKSRPVALDGTPIPEAVVLPPEELAARAIAELLSSGLWLKDQPAYYLALTDILRSYLEARYAEPVTAMTSVEVSRLLRKRADLQLSGSVRDLLSRADLVKFAKAKPGSDDGARDADLALAVIKATTPVDYAAKGRAT